MSGGSRFKLLGSSVINKTLLGLVLPSGEDNELALVGVESCNVELELFLTGGGSSVINGDTNRSGEGGGQTSTLQFLKGETTTVADFAGVLAGGLGNNRAERLNGSWEDAGSLGNSILVSLDLLGRLVEVSFGSSLPMFTKMYVDDHVVVFDHC
jgi:hypothetical protein